MDYNEYVIEETRDGNKIVKVYRENKWVYLGNRFRVKDNFNKVIKEFENINDETKFIIFGYGTGEWLKHIQNVLKINNKCLIIEPNKRLVEDNKENISNDNIDIIFYKEDIIKMKLTNLFEEFDFANLKLIVLPGYDKVYSDSVEKLIEIIKELIYRRASIHATVLTFTDLWTNSYIKNLDELCSSYDLTELKDVYKNKPAIIVSAGPSLEKNISLLKEVEDKFIIICGGRTIKSLKKINVNPDYVGVVDGKDGTYDLVKDYLDLKAPLICTDATNVDVVKNYKGKKLFYNNEAYDESLIGKELPCLSGGGSVAHTCTLAAAYFGCNPIIFIGQDLAYTNNKLHSEMALDRELEKLSEKQLSDAEEKSKAKKIWIDDIYGNKVETGINLACFKDQFEDIIKSYENIKFINATEGGALIKGTSNMTLKDVILEYGKNKKNIVPIEKKLFNLKDLNKFKKGLEEQRDILIQLEKRCGDLIELNKKYKQHFIQGRKIQDIDKVIQMLNEGEEFITTAHTDSKFIYNSIYPIVYKITVDESFRILADDKVKNKHIKIFNKSNELYKQIKDKCNLLIQLLNDVKFVN